MAIEPHLMWFQGETISWLKFYSQFPQLPPLTSWGSKKIWILSSIQSSRSLQVAEHVEMLVFQGKFNSDSMLELFLWLAFHCFCYYGVHLCLSCLTFSDSTDCRLLYPWNFPGKKTGVGCYFLLQGVYSNSGIELVVSCVSSRQTLTLSHLGSPFIIIIINNGLPQEILPLCLTFKLKCLCSEPCPPIDGKK